MELTLKQWAQHFLKQKQRPAGNICDGLKRAAADGTAYAGYYWRRQAGGYFLRCERPREEPVYTPPPMKLRQATTGRVATLAQWVRELDGLEPRYACGPRATAFRLLRAEKTGLPVHGSTWERVSE